MLSMILNNDESKVIEISTYSRALDSNPAVKMNLNLSMTDNYDPRGFEYLIDYADSEITSIVIKDSAENVLVNSVDIHAKLTSLNENCDINGRYGYASIAVLAPVVEQHDRVEEAAEEVEQ